MRAAEFCVEDRSNQSRAKALLCALRTVADTIRLGTLMQGAWVSGHRYRQTNERGPLVLRCETCGVVSRTELRNVED